MGNTPDLLASREVCERVGIDRSTLSRYVQLERITPAMRLPGRKGAMLFHPADVEALNDWYHGERLAEQAS
jgi:predicted site-specific integrase-resolvase